MKNIIIGILAHVDAGKTTLTEAMLYTSGAIRKLGRVDHQDAFLDNYIQERQRGITIFSKLAQMEFKDTKITIVDTPGHVDFAAEMERTLQVLDYAILVVNGREGVQGHTHTLGKLLKKYNIPTFVFVNKMDIEGSNKEYVLNQLKKYIGEMCIDFTEQAFEELAYCDDKLLDEYISKGIISDDLIREHIEKRNIIPCYFGSALKLTNVTEFLEGISKYTRRKEYPDEFKARVYKISRDNQNNRLTYLKLTGGSLKVKDSILIGENEEKVNQIRIYSGAKFKTVNEIGAGEICAVTGLEDTFPGQPLGKENDYIVPILEPVLTYKVIFSQTVNIFDCYEKIKIIGEEEPELNVLWDEELKEIKLQLMGQVQLEVITEIVKERFNLDISFDQGEILYKEILRGKAIGIGHFEPLRHYAEVQLLLEEGKRGSGVVVDAACSEDLLDKNWQRLIVSHINEKAHTGILTNSPITDIKITLIGGRAHLKHTEGGDFRQATYRAIRNGLLNGHMELLEPWYSFTLEIPQESTGKAMSDITLMSGKFNQPEVKDEIAIIQGRAPVSEMTNYSSKVASYTGGRGSLTLMVDGYDTCHNQEEVISSRGYDSMSDVNNTGDSVFCKNGTGFIVPWNKVKDYAHVEIKLEVSENEKKDSIFLDSKKFDSSDDELMAIFEKTYGKPKDKTYIHQQVIRPTSNKVEIVPTDIKEEYLLVDGYNIIYAWKELKELAKVSFDAARQALIEILTNYQGYKNIHVIVVFDAYKVKGGVRKVEKYDNIDVVYTKEAETADSYIEKFTYEKADKFLVRVATSDNLEQLIIVGNGGFKVSADEFYLEVKEAENQISEIIKKFNRESYLNSKVTIGDKLK